MFMKWWVFGTAVKISISHTGVTGFKSWLDFQSSFMLMHTLEAVAVSLSLL